MFVLQAKKAAGVVQEGCVCWRETDLGLLCPLYIFSAKWGSAYEVLVERMYVILPGRLLQIHSLWLRAFLQ